MSSFDASEFLDHSGGAFDGSGSFLSSSFGDVDVGDVDGTGGGGELSTPHYSGGASGSGTTAAQLHMDIMAVSALSQSSQEFDQDDMFATDDSHQFSFYGDEDDEREDIDFDESDSVFESTATSTPLDTSSVRKSSAVPQVAANVLLMAELAGDVEKQLENELVGELRNLTSYLNSTEWILRPPRPQHMHSLSADQFDYRSSNASL
jgi:hypothetical protein